MSLEISELESFLVLARSLHFRKASEQLFLSQPALSRKIRRLEEKVHGPLFVRTRRKVALTEAGRVLLPKARRLLEDAHSTLAATQAAVEGKAGTLRIGFGIASVAEILPRTILRFRKNYPDVQLEMRDMSSPSQIAALLDGGLDVGILRMPVAHRNLISIPLFREHLVLVSSAATSYRVRERLAGFRHKPFILIARAVSATLHDQCLGLCRRAGFTPNVVQEASETFTILNLVRAGLGVSLVPSSAKRMRVPGLRFHKLHTNEATWRIGAAWPRDSGRENLISRFVEMMDTVVDASGREFSAPGLNEHRD
jgi:DNA-binding transcriptional LysR family regulator